MAKYMSFNSENYLASFVNWEPRLDQAGVSSFSLDRMVGLLRIFRHPESALLFAHIAGSKGKGSTAAFLAGILRAAGHRVGLYTSPHLYSFHERIRVLNPGEAGPDPFEGMISSAECDELLRYHQEAIDHLRAGGSDITYYELLTALAVAHFAKKKVRVVVLETGLGGRLDATNYFETSVCGITPVGLEHTAILGKTLGLIAAEKAAIIKSPSQRVSFSRQEPEVMAVLEERARFWGILPTLIGKDMPLQMREEGPQGVCFSVTGRREYKDLSSSLAGEYQAENAALAIAMAEDLEAYGLELTQDAVRRGISQTVWPGRFEVFQGQPVVVADAAHTPESAAACVRAFVKAFPGRKAVLLLGISRDKDIAGVCQALGPIAKCVVTAKADHPRAFEFSTENLGRFFPSAERVALGDVPAAMKEAARLAGENGIVLAVGSVFLAAEVRKICINMNRI